MWEPAHATDNRNAGPADVRDGLRTELPLERSELGSKAFQPAGRSAEPHSGHEVPSSSCRGYQERRAVSDCRSALPAALPAEESLAPQKRVGSAREEEHPGSQGTFRMTPAPAAKAERAV